MTVKEERNSKPQDTKGPLICLPRLNHDNRIGLVEARSSRDASSMTPLLMLRSNF